MGKLEELREKLYRKKAEEILRPALSKPAEFPQRPKTQTPKTDWAAADSSRPQLIERVMTAQKASRHSGIYFLTLAILFLIAALAAVGYFLFYSPSGVEFEIVGPVEVEVGSVATFIVSIRNNGSSPLERGSLNITYGLGVIPIDSSGLGFDQERKKISLEDVLSGKELRQELRIRAFGRSGEKRMISAAYLYRPQNVASELVRKDQLEFLVSRVPVAVSMILPEAVSSGEMVEVSVGIDSESSTTIEAAAFRIDLPSGFELLFSNPAPSASPALFELGDLGPGVSKKIILKGRISGEAEEVKTFRAVLGRWRQEDKQWLEMIDAVSATRIASPLLSVQTRLNGRRDGSLVLGERLEGEIVYKNNTDEKLENIEITVSLPENLIELESILLPKGFYDATRRLAVWNSASLNELRELAPSKEGRIDFRLKLKELAPIRGFGDKNFNLPILTTISTASQPPQFRGINLSYQDRITLKLASRLTLSSRAAFYDSPFSNHGPLPPKVGEESSYTIIWQLTNTSNDLSQVEVRGILGGGVMWQDMFETSIGTVIFNQTTGEVVWRIPNLQAQTGILRPSAKAVFQAGIRPAENQIGTSPLLIQLISATGRDTFTNEELNSSARDLTTEISGDPRSNSNEWRVVK